MSSITTTRPGRSLTIVVWSIQILLAAFYGAVGVTKLTAPIPTLVAMMHWPAQAPDWFARFIGAVELAGAIGLILPAATPILPVLTTWAAIGLFALQICAITFHLSRGEVHVLSLNLVLLAMPAFVIWARLRAPDVADPAA